MLSRELIVIKYCRILIVVPSLSSWRIVLVLYSAVGDLLLFLILLNSTENLVLL